MNERIVKLITEADTYAWTVAEKYVARDCCNDGEVNYLWEDAFRENFAELIVRECINNVLDSTMEYCGRSQIAEELREHFGVE